MYLSCGCLAKLFAGGHLLSRFRGVLDGKNEWGGNKLWCVGGQQLIAQRSI